MRQKLTLLLVFAASFVFAQKQIQPYIFTNKTSKGTKTILIFATPKTANNVTFTLRNNKNDFIKNEKKEKISFEVFPFNEVIFRNKLKEALLTISSKEEEKDIIQFDEINREEYVKTARNIFQFFNALIITAFQYDTEPVAGTLKYSLKAVITKNTIEGQKTNNFFQKKKDSLDKYYNTKDKKIIMNDAFLNYVVDTLRYNLKYYDEEEKKKILKKLYNTKQIRKLLDSSFLSKYISLKSNIMYHQLKIKKIKDTISSQKKTIKYYNNLIKNLTPEIIKVNLDLKDSNLSQVKKDSLKIIKNHIENKLIKYNKKLNKADSILKRVNIKTDTVIPILQGNKKALSNQLNNIKKNIAIEKKLIYDYEKTRSNNDSLTIEQIELLHNKLKAGINKQFRLESEKLKIKNEIDEIDKKTTFFIEKTKNFTKIESLEGLIHDLQIDINILISSKFKDISDLPLYDFKITNIELDINNGFIEHATVIGKITKPFILEHRITKEILTSKSKSESETLKTLKKTNKELGVMLEQLYNEKMVQEILHNNIGDELKFTNTHPMGFSSKFDFDDIYNYQLFYSEGENRVFSIEMGDIIKMYLQKHQNNRLDFSPKNQIISLPSDDTDKDFNLELKKEKSSKILAARIYSDFLGLKKSDPNGLIQVEIEKEIPLWTKRSLFKNSENGENYGLFNYLKFNFNWSRIEDREQELVLNNYDPLSYLDLIRFQNTSIGVNFNIYTLDFPHHKFRIEANFGTRYGRTRLIRNETQISNNSLTTNTVFNNNIGFFSIYPDVIFRIRPEERFGGFLSYRPYKVLVPRSDDLKAFKSIKNVGQWSHRIEFSAFYTPNIKSDNKFFFRYRYTNTANQEANGFSQFQVGYLMYLKF